MDMCSRMATFDRLNQDGLRWRAGTLSRTVETVDCRIIGGGGGSGSYLAANMTNYQVLERARTWREISHLRIARYPADQWYIAIHAEELQSICKELLRVSEESTARLKHIQELCR